MFEEVLPSIRKHGGYLTPSKLEDVLLNPDTLIQLAQNLKAEQEKSKALAAKIERDRPKTVFADAVATSSSTILVGDLAKILRGNGVDIGANRLFAWLRDNKFLISRRGQDWNMPTQRSMDLGLFQIKETAVTHADGHVTVSKTPKVTGKGQRYFIDKFLGQESSYDGQLELTHT
ncbi:phage antirepressor KilAC domain-containing protein [Corynebacterium renale]|uniref:phage antirepressor KilAC domain-containing protein n=1 Tax=Corynebacterium renale TaxID=1724 RepID=UPI003D15F3F7